MEHLTKAARQAGRAVSAYLGLTPGAAQRRSAWGALTDHNFRWYFAGSVCSDLGTWVQNTAQVLLAYRLTHSVLTVALVTCAQFTSPLVLGPWAGVLADRFGGRRTLLWTELASAVTAAIMSGLVFAGLLNEAMLIAGAIVVGLTFTFALPARNVTVRRLVPEKTRAGYAMDSVSYNLGRAVGPPLGVAVVAVAGYGYAFAINAISFFVFTWVLWLKARGTTEPERRSRVRDGFVIAVKDYRILVVLVMVVAVTVAADPVLVLGPALASHVFRVPASWSGAFIAALGTGSVVGSLLPTRREPSIRLAATALASLAVCMLFFALAPWLWLSIAAAFAAGVTCLMANSATRTLLAKQAGPQREASVMAVWAIAWAGSKPFASLADGLSATHLGVRSTGILLAVPAVLPLVVIIAASAFADKHRHRARKTGMADNALVTHNQLKKGRRAAPRPRPKTEGVPRQPSDAWIRRSTWPSVTAGLRCSTGMSTTTPPLPHPLGSRYRNTSPVGN